ncbi:MAG: polysaccharide biosynthesis protein [Syntrophomonadaceae bacterium]|nr:polysaccharide biosynthesis protein [Syntrophomonadaceae bacterium]
MLKRFLKDSTLYSIPSFLSGIISILLVPLYTRVLSPADYGAIDIISVISSIVIATVSLQITQAVARLWPDASDPKEKVKYATVALWFSVATLGLSLVIGLLFSRNFSYWVFGTDGNELVFQLAVSAIFIVGIFNVLQNQLRWELKSVQSVTASIITLLVSVSVSIILVLVYRLGLIGVYSGTIIGNFIGVLVAVYYLRSSYGLVFSYTKLKEMLHYSIALVPSAVGVYVALYIDRIAIKELMTLTDVGIYGVAFRLASVIGLVTAGVQGSLTPLIYNNYQLPSTPGEVARIYRYYLFFTLMVFMALGLFSQEILMVFTTPDYYEAYKIVPILVAAIIINGMYIFAPGLGIGKKTKTISAIYLFSAMLNIVLNFLLIPFFGVAGAALATVIGGLFQFFMYAGLGSKYYPIPFEVKRCILASISVIGLLILGMCIRTSFWLTVITKSLLSVGIFIFLFLVLINLDERKRIIIEAKKLLLKKKIV